MSFETSQSDRSQPLNSGRLDGGRRCPPFTSRLFALAEVVASGHELSESQQELKEHVHACGHCRRIYDGALFFAGRELDEEAQSAAERLATEWREAMLDRIRKAVRTAPGNAIRLSAHLAERARASGLEESDVLQALELPPDAGLSILDRVSDASIRAAIRMEMPRGLIRSWLTYTFVADRSSTVQATRIVHAPDDITPRSLTDFVAILDERIADAGIDVSNVRADIERLLEEVEGERS